MSVPFSLIDRCALIVRPTWRFVEWLKNLDEEVMPDENSIYTQTVYLVADPGAFDAAGTAATLEACFPDIASNEFASWWTDEFEWPVIENLSDFFEYFECTPSEMVIDLAEDEIFDN